MANRPQSPAERRSDLSDRMSTGREDWQQHRQDQQGDRQDWRDNNREDWQNWADDNHNNHGDWYNDCWHGDWYPGSGWNYMWDNYPVAAALGVTSWGINRMAYGMGYWGYANPYVTDASAGYYSEPLVVYADSGTTAAPTEVAPDDTGTVPASTVPQPTDAGMTALNAARTAFYDGDAAQALTLVDTTLQTMPHDAVVHEFRGLVLFALKKYPESAAAVYAVLSAGPGWDWTTMAKLYPGVDVYTQQLRELEAFARENPKSPDAHFLLGYQYLTMGHAENASKQFKLAQVELPDDKLLVQLVGMTTPPDPAASTVPPPPPPSVAPDKIVAADKLVGHWQATSDGAQFRLDLTQDGQFVWTYSRGNEQQSVKGVYAVDQNNLALEPDAGGTMVAEVDLSNPSQFLFKMVGGGPKDPGLQFKKT